MNEIDLPMHGVPTERIGASDWSLSDAEAIRQIPIELTIAVGRVRISIGELMSLQRGALLQLDRTVGEPVEVFANERLIAHGHIVVLDKDATRFAVSLTEVVSGAKPR